MKDKKIKQLTKGAETIILATDKGLYIVGTTPNILNAYVNITRQLLECKGVTKEKLDKIYNLAFKTEKELKEEVETKIKDFFDKLTEKLGGNNE